MDMIRFAPLLKFCFLGVVVLGCREDDPEERPASHLSEGLVAHYAFDGNADDLTSNHLHGTVHGATLTTDRKGAANQAYTFDGIDDYIRVPDNDKLDLQTDFSISLWVSVSSNQEAEGGINDILRKWNGDAQGYPFAVSYLNPLAEDTQEDRIVFARYDSQTCGNTAQTWSSTIENDTYIHVALIRQGDRLRTYVNNVLSEQKIDNTTCETENDADMTIGCRGNLMRFFKGKIDDIRIYDRVLTEGEVAELYAK